MRDPPQRRTFGDRSVRETLKQARFSSPVADRYGRDPKTLPCNNLRLPVAAFESSKPKGFALQTGTSRQETPLKGGAYATRPAFQDETDQQQVKRKGCELDTSTSLVLSQIPEEN